MDKRTKGKVRIRGTRARNKSNESRPKGIAANRVGMKNGNVGWMMSGFIPGMRVLTISEEEVLTGIVVASEADRGDNGRQMV